MRASNSSTSTSTWSCPEPTPTRQCPVCARTSRDARRAARTTRACALSSRRRRKFCGGRDAYLPTAHPAPTAKGVSMSTFAEAFRPVPVPRSETLRRDPAAQAFLLMRITFVVAPIVFGLDKFANVLTNDWTRYLSSQFNDIIPGSAGTAMHIVGVVEIVAGLTVLLTPRFGGFLVAAWLGGIILNLLLVGGYGDIALRDFGLLLGALSLARLASAYPAGSHSLREIRRRPEARA